MNLIHKLLHVIKKSSPALRKRITILLLVLLFFNGLSWALTFFFSYHYPVLIGLVTLAYGLGLRHAVDADHIAAIDNATRKMMRDGKQPVAVGFFFSLGHSTVVILLSVAAAASASFVKHNLPTFQHTGSLIGMSVSSLFLLFIGIINLFALIDIIKTWKKITKNKEYDAKKLRGHMHVGGVLARIFGPLIKSVNDSWHMYPLGFLFGLGFDTASEVGLLSISAVSGASGVIPIWIISLLPLSFTAGMALIDSLDSLLMLGTYGWAYIKPLRKLYYNLNITLVSVIVAILIGSVEGLQILNQQLGWQSGFFTFINGLSFGALGYIIIAIFLLVFLISFLVYRFKKITS